MATLPDTFTLDSLVDRFVTNHPDRTALRTADGDYTYRELGRRADAFAGLLAAHGVEPADVVMIAMANRPEYVVAQLGAVKAGAAILLDNAMGAPGEYAYKIDDAGASVAVGGPETLDVLADALDTCDGLETALAFPGERALPEGVLDLDQLLAENRWSPPSIDVSPDDVATVGFTGGTTGRPKGVVHTHGARTLNLVSQVYEFEFSSDDTLLLMTPLAHAARSFLWGGFVRGATAVIRDGYDVQATLDDIETHGVTVTFLVPTMIYRLLDATDLDDRETASLETVIYGTSPMRPERLKDGIDRLGPVFKQFYGMAELPNVIATFERDAHVDAVTAGDDHRLTAAGTPGATTDIEIRDIETDESLPPGDEGEIVVSAPGIMREYHQRPDATEEVLDDGWLYTGDVGTMDRDGFLYLLDRKDNVIISGGMNVYSTEVEDALDGHPDVREVAVIGIPHDDWGEAVTAVVVPIEGAEPTEDELIRFAGEGLAGYKKPKRVEFVDTLPRTEYGKIDKASLREPYWAGEGRRIG